MKLDIVARSGVLYSGEVSEIVVPAYDGELGILPGRAPVLSVVMPGPVRFVTSTGDKQEIVVGKGFLTVDHDAVMVVVENHEE
ncbi:ATP synthase F1 subunit epsilon [Arcanobacterium phocae]|uniref:ATP synthase F1 subunit epsilon n=1 Tax=Arcanobacterium phocae TaxID=131112 RepID=UPI001C0E9458|nr:ATP synthase F1 subunit epsilon [Arcanobacterium phocae]